MLKLVTILYNRLKYLIFVLILLELVVIYCALTEDFTNLILSCVDNKLSFWGYLFSVEEPVKYIFKLVIPGTLIFHFFNIKFSKREKSIKIIENIYRQFTTLQLFISFFLLSTLCYYLNSFYSFLYSKYKHCKL
jgi:hypothetical protein